MMNVLLLEINWLPLNLQSSVFLTTQQPIFLPRITKKNIVILSTDSWVFITSIFIYKWIHRGIVKLHNSKYINRGCPVVSGLCILFSPPAGHVKSNGRSEENSFTPIFGHNVPASLAAPSGHAAQRRALIACLFCWMHNC